jgi:hypothetical protein
VSDFQNPSVGRIVHYVSRGSADGRFPATCRAAVVTEIAEPEQPRLLGLAVLNPTGLFFDQLIPYDDENAGGTWHWPERV